MPTSWPSAHLRRSTPRSYRRPDARLVRRDRGWRTSLVRRDRRGAATAGPLPRGPGLWDNLGGLAALVAPSATVIRWEQRGCGRSDRAGPYQLDRSIEDLDQLRAHLGFDRWIVGGHSWGATLALHYALSRPPLRHQLGGQPGAAGRVQAVDRARPPRTVPPTRRARAHRPRRAGPTSARGGGVARGSAPPGCAPRAPRCGAPPLDRVARRDRTPGHRLRTTPGARAQPERCRSASTVVVCLFLRSFSRARRRGHLARRRASPTRRPSVEGRLPLRPG